MGLATMNDLWSEGDKNGAVILNATDTHTSYIENKGSGKFEIKPMPFEAQESPIFGMQSEDVDGDGNLDVLMIGNDYGMDPYSGRHDAFNGLFLKGDGKGNFNAVAMNKSGFFVKGDAKALAKIHTAKNEDIFIATQNQDSLMVYGGSSTFNKNILKWINLKPDDFSAEIIFKDGRKRHVEFYYGSGYLSQSSRKLPVEKNVSKITITNFKGIKREVL